MPNAGSSCMKFSRNQSQQQLPPLEVRPTVPTDLPSKAPSALPTAVPALSGASNKNVSFLTNSFDKTMEVQHSAHGQYSGSTVENFVSVACKTSEAEETIVPDQLRTDEMWHLKPSVATWMVPRVDRSSAFQGPTELAAST